MASTISECKKFRLNPRRAYLTNNLGAILPRNAIDFVVSRQNLAINVGRYTIPALHLSLSSDSRRLTCYHAAPALLGFGISKPEHVKAAIEAGAAGAISGSAIVQLIEQHQAEPARLLSELGQFVKAMKAATQR